MGGKETARDRENDNHRRGESASRKREEDTGECGGLREERQRKHQEGMYLKIQKLTWVRIRKKNTDCRRPRFILQDHVLLL